MVVLAAQADPADFLLENLKIQTHVIETAWRSGVQRLLFLGSSCIYPKHAAQPIREEALITGIKPCKALRRRPECDLLGNRPAAARISARGRSGRGLCVRLAAMGSERSGEHR